MSNITVMLSLLASLHGTPKQCATITSLLLEKAISDAETPYEPVHIDEDLASIKKWRTSCMKSRILNVKIPPPIPEALPKKPDADIVPWNMFDPANSQRPAWPEGSHNLGN